MNAVRDWEIWTFDTVRALEEFWKPRRGHDFVRSVLPKDYQTVIDAGCGIGMYYELLVENGASYFGIDDSQAMVERAKKRVGAEKFVKGDVYHIPFPNQSFDMVFCWNVLLHLPDIEVPVSELCRVSRRYVVFNIWSARERNTLNRGGWNEYIAEYTEDFVRMLLKQQPYDTQVIPHTYRFDNGQVENFNGRELLRKAFLLNRRND